MASYRDENRTKLSSRATPFRPSIGALSTSSSLADSLAPYGAHSSHPNLTDLDSSTGSVGTSWSAPTSNTSRHGLTPPTPPGQFIHPAPAHIPGTWPSAAWGPDPQGIANSNAASSGFKLGDFRSKLLKRAQTHTDQAFETYKQNDSFSKKNEAWSGEVRFMQALMSDGFPMPRNTMQTGEGQSSEILLNDRRQAMNKCMQPLEVPDTVESTNTNSEPRPSLIHAATFNEGMTSKQVAPSSTDPMKEALPIRNTFIHFPEASDGPMASAFQWSSAPTILCSTEFHTKYPGMEAAHIRGDCRPCVYFTKKQDGCRWGGDCEFCHLCPVGSLQKKRKEKVKAIKEKEFKEIQERRAFHGW